MQDLYPSVDDLLQSSQCSFCPASFSNSSARRLHEIKKHNVIRSESDKRLHAPQYSLSHPSSSIESTRFFCPQSNCGKFYGTKKSLAQHYVKRHRVKSEVCELCGFTFALKRDRLYHEKKRCPNRLSKSCEGRIDSISRDRNTRVAAVFKNGINTVVVMNSLCPNTLISQIIEGMCKENSLGVDGTTQTDVPFPSIQPLIVDSTSQTVQYPPYSHLETRHVETSMDADLDDFRHIETQTLPLWDVAPLDINRYWQDI
ncbi:hypothetical protein PFISCL1PPCAC_15586 [Pristionchus fissidentatus]|uniref:C2H2-type domain-containing protein n=1 Tax=Pristionchus fissidentatus TaxID=1538716 RepID=A0AAV5VXF7_9BILA|nr:hypothetical protein PFISCL1PPCAC_15586 [Pristionchus fissidentatus]